jgi:MFS family permease
VHKDPIVLRTKARKIRKETGDERWKAPMEKIKKSIARTIGTSLLRPFQLLIYEPMCLNLCIFSAILLGVLYLFFGAFPLVFVNNHGFNLWQVGLTFLGILIGMLLAAASDPLWHSIRDRLVHRLEVETGIQGASEPEFRLPPAILGAALVSVGLFMFAWTTFPWVHWIVPIIGSGIFGAGYVVCFLFLYTASMSILPSFASRVGVGSDLHFVELQSCSRSLPMPIYAPLMTPNKPAVLAIGRCCRFMLSAAPPWAFSHVFVSGVLGGV